MTEDLTTREEYDDFVPFYDYKKSPKKITQYAEDFKRYDENGELV